MTFFIECSTAIFRATQSKCTSAHGAKLNPFWRSILIFMHLYLYKILLKYLRYMLRWKRITAHGIQQPNPELRILNFMCFFHAKCYACFDLVQAVSSTKIVKLASFWPLAHVSGPTSYKLVVVLVVVVVGNVHTFKYGVIWK